jgi:hypothetical protein
MNRVSQNGEGKHGVRHVIAVSAACRLFWLRLVVWLSGRLDGRVVVAVADPPEDRTTHGISDRIYRSDRTSTRSTPAASNRTRHQLNQSMIILDRRSRASAYERSR